MGGCKRYWTEAERRNLFQHYFDGELSLCPVCLEALCFRMIHTREAVVLRMQCKGCENLAILFFGGLIALPAEKVSHGGGG